MSIRDFLKSISFWQSLLGGIQFCVYLLGIGLAVFIASKLGVAIGSGNWPPPLERLADWAQLIIAYAAIFAIGQYAVAYADIADKKTKTVLEFVKFFREVVLTQGSEIKIYLRKNKISIPVFNIRKNTPHFKFTEEEFFKKIAPNQKNLVDTYTKLMQDDPILEDMLISLLNSIEEFSIGILNSNSQKHKAVASIKKPFIEIVEQNAIPIYFQIGMMADQFSYLSLLYKYWKKDLGFLPFSKDDRQERYKERAKKYKL